MFCITIIACVLMGVGGYVASLDWAWRLYDSFPENNDMYTDLWVIYNPDGYPYDVGNKCTFTSSNSSVAYVSVENGTANLHTRQSGTADLRAYLMAVLHRYGQYK